MLTMGNLFSGSGTWELAAELVGIEPRWEAEIEPYPVALEAKRFPQCKQLGDVSKINGADIEPVDIFTNSSPCQDLSVAGKREGLKGDRSGLFRDAVRIAKEMRQADAVRRPDKYVRPRFWCWENVPGAFSSGHGRDFKAVLESVAEIIETKDIDIPIPEGGVALRRSVGWRAMADCLENTGCTIRWRRNRPKTETCIPYRRF